MHLIQKGDSNSKYLSFFFFFNVSNKISYTPPRLLYFQVFSVCSEFHVIFVNFCNICIIIIYIVGTRYCAFLFLFITFQLNNLWEQMHVIKTWLQLIIRKLACRELLRFKNLIFKENCETFTKWKIVTETLSVNKFSWEKLRSRNFILNLSY